MKPIARGLARHRHREARVDELRAFERRRVLVDDRDRARLVAVRRAGDHLPLRLLGREPERRDDRLVGAVADRDDRRVDAGNRPAGLERAREHLVEVDRRAQLAEEAVAPALFLRALERLRELAHHALHARVHLGDEREHLLLPAAPAPRERTSTTSSTSASTAAAAPTATSAVVAVTASAIISLVREPPPCPETAKSPSRLTVIGFWAAGYGFKTIKPLVRIRTNRPRRCRRILAAKRILPFDAGGCASLPCSSGWQGPDPRPAFVVSAPI